MLNQVQMAGQPNPQTFSYFIAGQLVEAPIGSFLRFAATGGFLRTLTQRTNGLGYDFRVNADGSLTRDIF